MNPNRACRAESDTVELFNFLGDGELEQLILNLNLDRDGISSGTPRTQRASEIWDAARKRGGTVLAELEEIVRAQLGKPLPSYWIFLSCSELERKDVHCRAFFDDLAAVLAVKLNLPVPEFRYLDEGNAQDSLVWSPWSLRAVRRCRVLVCLYSKAFFASPYCGRVWGSFVQRLKTYQADLGQPTPAPLIFPLVWAPPDDCSGIVLPRVARELEPQQNALQAFYHEKGLRFLVEHRNRNDAKADYGRFLEELSTRLVAAATTDPLPEDTSIAPLSETKSLFYPAFGGTPPPQKGSSYAKFVYVAARSSEISDLRIPEAYDDLAEGWRPYHPLSQERLGAMSSLAASQEGIIPLSIALDDTFLAKIREAETNGNIIIVLVDPWTVLLENYGGFLTQYDGAQFFGSILIVCWNDEDSDTQAARPKLVATLQTALHRTFRASTPERFRNAIGTIGQLRQELADALLWARREIADKTSNPKEAEGLPYIRPADLGTAPLQSNLQVPARKAESPSRASFRQPRIDGPTGGMLS
jgi:FxsC-like protein